ncbi:lysylphosphatidylglycerol synthase transmembrane domain-containing protein [Dongia sp.]|uniref:lysylphosphatidylglycerol synthase transmembrane domain-containing protein n=1 Tax=Dongia sp. TaxID=1977262 RepID=UPI0037513F2B
MTAESTSRPKDRRMTILLAAAKLLVSIVAFWLVLRAVDFEELLKQFSAADPVWIGFGFLTLVVHLALVVWRWDYVMLRFYGLRLGLRRLSLVFGLGEAVAPILPSFLGTDLVRTLALAGSASLITIAKTVLVDRVIGLVALLVLIALSVPFFAAMVSSGPALAVVAALGFGGLLAFVVGLQTGPLIARIPAFGQGLAKLLMEIRRVAVDRRAMPLLVGSGLLVHLTSVLTFWSAARMLHGSVDFVSALLIVPSALLIAALPVSLGGWGVREGALVTGFALVGADAENIVAASICFGLSSLVSGAIGLAAAPILPGRAVTGESAP